MSEDEQLSKCIIEGKILEFVEDIIDSYQEESEANIYERSSDTQKDLAELEEECSKWKKKFNAMFGKYKNI